MTIDGGRGRLAEVVAQPDTVLFVGAGVSVWSGLPNWRGLIAELADFIEERGSSSHLVRRELEHGDLLQAASFGVELLSLQDRASFLRQACRYETATPSPLHKRLATLGPRAFITTNYDKLLEGALQATRPDIHFRLVNNTNLIETGSIIQSRARDFVFKPHGDIDETASVVLTREQYRVLQHEKRNAFEAFKMLLAGRPVVFVGFGLRDPDFLLIKDTLASIYMGAVQDHYAIAPDVDPQEVDYWRNHYGIHLVSYETDASAEAPKGRHGPLLSLLDEVAAETIGAEEDQQATPQPTGGQALMMIQRHALAMAQLGPGPDVEILPLAASPFPRRGSIIPPRVVRNLFIDGDAVSGLQANRSKLLLTGPPGAGKTFVVRSAVANMAREFLDEILEGNPISGTGKPIPIYVDLRDYRGGLWEMIAESLPLDLPLDQLLAQQPISFFIDGLNEVSAQIVEDNTLSEDLLDFLDRSKDSAVTLITRFGEEHAELELPEIGLEAIPRSYVVSTLEEHGVSGPSVSEEFVTLLERPFFYRFCVEHDLWDKRTPHAIYSAVVGGLNQRAESRFGLHDLMGSLGRVAFGAIEAGDLQISSDQFVDALVSDDVTPDSALALVNWLLGEGLLIPRRERRVAFFHHSVSEYLAAYDLVSRFRANPDALTHLLQGRRWDQVVLLSLGFFPSSERRSFFEKVLKTDAELGVRGLAFIEDDWEVWTAEALRYLRDLTLSWEDDLNLSEVLENARFAESHEPLLLELSSRPERLGGAALAMTLGFGGDQRVERAIDDIFEHPDDHNRCSAVGNGLKWAATTHGVRYVLECLRAFPLGEEDQLELEQHGEAPSLSGLIAGAHEAFSGIGLDDLRCELRPLTEEPVLVLVAIARLLWEDESARAIELTGELLEVRPYFASVALHFQLAHRYDFPDISTLDPPVHGAKLLEAERLRRDGWAADTIRLLGGYSDAWRAWARETAEQFPRDLSGAVLRHAAHEDDRFFRELGRLLESGVDWSTQPTNSLWIVDTDWTGHEELFLSLLKAGDKELTSTLLRRLGSWRGEFNPFESSVDIDDLDWWIDYLVGAGEDSVAAGEFLAAAATPEAVNGLLRIFKGDNNDERVAVSYYVLGHVNGLRLSDLSDDGIRWSLDDLLSTDAHEWTIEQSVLANLATENFVERELLPLLELASGKARENLLLVIRKAGDRHRRRYVTTAGDLI